MSHLLPEQRTDKNGVTSTKWVKPVASSPLTHGSIPALAPAVKRGSPAVRAERAFLELKGVAPELTVQFYTGQNLRFLAEYEPELLDCIMESARKADAGEMAILSHLMKSGLPDRPFESDKLMDEFLEKTMPTYYRVAKNIGLASSLFPDKGPELQIAFIRGLAASAESVTGMSFRDEDCSRGQAAIIILGTTDTSMQDIEEDDISFISGNIDKVLPLVPELLKRQATSRSLIESLWDNESQVLNEGVL
jgi:hypothetical protein